MTEAALRSPGERVEDVIYPAAPGGQETLTALRPRASQQRYKLH